MAGTLLKTAHNQWASRPQDQRFQTLDDLWNSVNNRRMRSRSADIVLKSIEAKDDNGNITFNHGIKAVEPSHWSFSQFASAIKAPAEYLRRIPTPLAIQNINHGIKSTEVDQMKFMTIINPDDEGMNVLQAVTSPTYGRIWDADAVDAAKRAVTASNGRFYNPKAYDPATGQPIPSGLYASDRDVFIFMIDGGSLLDAGPRAQINRGFFMWNSEVGCRTFGFCTFLFNHCCGNHLVWGATDIREVKIRHTSGGPTRFDTEALPGLLKYVNTSAAPETALILKAQDWLLPVTEEKEMVKWLQEKKFTKTEAVESIAFAKKEEGDCRTLWQVVQGATAYARGFDFADARVELETKAGNLMNIIK
jgi:hypothetical protein